MCIAYVENITIYVDEYKRYKKLYWDLKDEIQKQSSG